MEKFRKHFTTLGSRNIELNDRLENVSINELQASRMTVSEFIRDELNRLEGNEEINIAFWSGNFVS